MIRMRKSAERGHADHGWPESRHSFSFGTYNDPAHVHWGPLRVINEDRVAAGQGFGRPGHRDMEIISYVLDGALAHRDSIGNASRIVPGDVQRMSAGTGVEHAEFNPDATAPVHFLQIWIIPDRDAVVPSWEQKHFPDDVKRGQLRLVASRDGTDGSVRIHQDARPYAGRFDPGEHAVLALAPGRLGYVHAARGTAIVNGHALAAGDALLYADESVIDIRDGVGAELLVFDLPP